ncbi:MAG: carboxymuconolactone decarboxylase family protein, partial [Sphingobium sp.]
MTTLTHPPFSTSAVPPASHAGGTAHAEAISDQKVPMMTDTFRTTMPLRGEHDPDPAISAPLAAARQTLGFVPNMYAAMANLPALLDTYNHGYQRFREQAGFTPFEQEVILLTVSRENGCHYCVAAHSFVADRMSKVPPAITDAIRNDEPIADARIEALRAFTRAMVAARGNPGPEDARAF